MQDELRKLATLLRKRADEYDQNKLIKNAHIVRSATALGLLKQKLRSK